MAHLLKDFKWIGPKVNCYNAGLNPNTNDFYRSFFCNNTTYNIGDFVIYNGTNNKKKQKVCKLMCTYKSHETWLEAHPYRAVVRWYNKPKINNILGKSLMPNEIIENLEDIEVFISLENIQRKCKVIFLSHYEQLSPTKYDENFQRNNYICRFKFKNDKFEPIFKEKENIMESTPKLNLSCNNSVICISDSDSSEFENLNKKGSPVEKCNTNKLTPNKVVSVKRNLNESFNSATNSQESTPNTLNYSIVEDEIDPLKLKLRLSNKQNVKVVLTKLEDELVDLYTKKANNLATNELDSLNNKERYSLRSTPLRRRNNLFIEESISPLRRSSRKIQRKSYTDYVSPIKYRRQTSNNSEIYVATINSEKRHRTDSTSSLDVAVKSPKKKLANEIMKTRSSRLFSKQNDAQIQAESEIVTKTPRKKTINNEEGINSTPTKNLKLKEPKTAISELRTPKKQTTPIKLIREGVLTPTLQKRMSSIKLNSTPLMKARAHLHVSYVPEGLPCREKEFNDIYNFLEGKLADGCGGCMYISGVPGTGKTATVTSVIKKLELGYSEGFKYININGMRLTEPKQSYVEILKQLNGKTVPWEQAQNTLQNIFTKPKNKSTPIILLVDELDILCTKRQDVVYNLLDWPTKAITQLIVITIANTMDLPERLLMGRVTSRLGLTRLTFQPYTHKQLQEIVTKRLMGTNAFNPDAVQLVARKVASVSGDARRALDICRRAAEIAEIQGPKTLVSMSHVNEALNAMITQPKVQAIKHCSQLQQLLLQAVVAETERTGVEETTFKDIYEMLVSVSTINGFRMVSMTIALKAVSYLGACRLLLTDNKLTDVDQRIILNVSPDDVYYALKKD